jgi:uncharacterized protein (TIGR02328 family)
VDYVFKHPYFWLCKYHLEIIAEMDRRGFKFEPRWGWYEYRGKKIGIDKSDFTRPKLVPPCSAIYPEHDSAYLNECIANLARKGVVIDRKKVA